MNSNTDNKKNKPNWIVLRLVSLLFLAVLVIALAIYFPGNDEAEESGEASMKQTSFEGRGYDNAFEINADKADFEKGNPDPEGTVTDYTEKEKQTEPSTDEADPEKVVPQETETTDEPKNLESLIANSQSSVYTIYTDLEQGSGFLFNSKGDIVTNAHVVKDASYVTVMNSEGYFYDGRIVGVSETTDIALIRVAGLEGKKPLPIEKSQVPVNTPVFTLGSPGNTNNTSTIGEITAIGQSFDDEYQYVDLYEMSAEIKLGSSGGPLISSHTGKILGINSIVLTENPKIGYSIPLYTVTSQLEKWASAELPVEEETDIVLPDIEEAYFNEELLRSFMIDFYDLIAPSLEYKEGHYYKYSLLAGSQAETAAVEMVENLKSSDRTFESLTSTISDVEIYDDKAEVYISANFTFRDNKDGSLVSINHSYVYEVVIDEYGDYQIQSIRNQN